MTVNGNIVRLHEISMFHLKSIFCTVMSYILYFRLHYLIFKYASNVVLQIAEKVIVPVYGFLLKGKEELRKWMVTLPIVIEEDAVIRNMDICSKHWLVDTKYRPISRHRKKMPFEPP